ncbi:DNA-binding transcriptional regulator, MarR family [Nonomuraea solani]|uniref:DNA-binding transcriptional regulator, MarR family n=1 Tax=Nonomuraea solani TaxID=1144553 RepID=A0A1H6F1L9_9ACTN|nr:MarR family transcriptional regulator [Nonomuraea solani]SEH03251.1 DNA-binding transcriptional regulator, MarR family [Nonomuraea solani]
MAFNEFDRLSRSTGFLLAWVAADGGERYAKELATFGLKAHHVGVLTLLQDGPLPQSRLSERLGVFKPVMVTLLRDLEGMGLVRRHAHPTDGRALEVHLLPAGRERLEVVEEAGRRLSDEFFAPLTPEERLTLHELLTKLAEPEPEPGAGAEPEPGAGAEPEPGAGAEAGAGAEVEAGGD